MSERKREREPISATTISGEIKNECFYLRLKFSNGSSEKAAHEMMPVGKAVMAYWFHRALFWRRERKR